MIRNTAETVENGKPAPKKYILIFLISVVLIGFATSGYNGQNTNYNLFIMFGLWVCTAIIINPRAFFRMFHKKTLIAFSLYILFFILLSIFSPNLFETAKVIGSTLVLFSPVLIYLYFIEIEQYNLFKLLVIISILIWVYFCITAIIFYSKNPSAARMLASNADAFNNLAIGGGYSLAYGSTIFAIYLFDICINKCISSKKLKLLFYIGIIIFSVLVIETLSTITIIGLFLGFSLVIIFKTIGWVKARKDDYKGIKIEQLIMGLLLCVILTVLLVNTKNIGSILIKETYSKNDIISLRLQEVGVKLAYGDQNVGTGDFDLRMNIFKDTVSKFFKSPIIGNGYKYGFTFYGGAYEGIGNHEEWIDILAIHGLVGGIPFLLIYIYGAIWEGKYCNKFVSPSWIFTLFFLGIFNPFKSFQSNFIVFFMLPSIGWLLYKKEK